MSLSDPGPHRCAHVSGWPAWVFTEVLRRHLAGELERLEEQFGGRLAPARRSDVVEAFQAVRAAGEAFRESLPATARAGGNEADRQPPASPSWQRYGQLLSTAEAADRLDLDPSRVRQLARADIIGEPVGRVYVFHAEELDAYLAARQLGEKMTA